jgi:hypothetical protein
MIEKQVFFATTLYYIGNFFCTSHASGDVPVLASKLHILSPNFDTPIEILLGKFSK